ncbi:hypothetical protein TI04_08110 [Achromatium sp. WMS2]|nr:hypothetical protein TI04_08110 [Achromatium sp. WMS2]
MILSYAISSNYSYAQTIEPIFTQDKRNIVKMGIYITNIFEMNFAGGYYKTTFWLWSKSKDQFYPLEQDIEIMGARDIKINPPTSLLIEDGLFYKSVKVAATVNEKWDIRAYPFDTQRLRIAIESTSSDISTLKFVTDSESSGFDGSIAMTGWKIAGMEIATVPYTYQTDWGIGHNRKSTYSRFIATITLKRSSHRILGTAFLGFFVANILTGAVLLVESFAATRAAIPFLGRLNIVIGSLFGAVGNKYIIDNALPASDAITLPDLIQIGSFLAIAVSLLTVIVAEILDRLKYPGDYVNKFARINTLIYIVSQVVALSYLAYDHMYVVP